MARRREDVGNEVEAFAVADTPYAFIESSIEVLALAFQLALLFPFLYADIQRPNPHPTGSQVPSRRLYRTLHITINWQAGEYSIVVGRKY